MNDYTKNDLYQNQYLNAVEKIFLFYRNDFYRNFAEVLSEKLALDQKREKKRENEKLSKTS